jgi:dTDP-4-amino-4,6-dideoxygalactose transaminase
MSTEVVQRQESERRVRFLRPFVPPYAGVEQRFRAAYAAGSFTKGPELVRFERAVAEHLGVSEVVATSSCTLGLTLVCRALGLKGEVIVPSFTFMASVSSLAWAGCEPVFVDINPDSWLIDLERVEAAITARTSAIVAVHLFGAPAPTAALEELAARRGIRLVFDAAHGFGSLHDGRPLGRGGDAAVFSMSPTKLLVTGEGGVVATNDQSLAEELRALREYGNSGDYDSRSIGVNARLPEIAAIMGHEGLAVLEANAAGRNAIAARYTARLAGIPGIRVQRIAAGDRSSFKDFSIVVIPEEFGATRDELVAFLTSRGIETRNYYVPPVHRQRAYRDIGARFDAILPVTDWISERVTSLPIWTGLADADVDYVSRCIAELAAGREGRPT